jgi:hypothetical protein
MAFPVVLRLKYKGKPVGKDADRPEGIAIRAWRVVLKTANRAMAYHWHENFLPLHFGPGVRVRYGGSNIKQRSTKWIAQKLGIKRGDIEREANIQPGDGAMTQMRKRQEARQRLVSARGGVHYNYFTGTLKDSVETAIFRAFPSRFRIEMPVPGYIPSRRKDLTQPDIRAELTTILPSEVKELQKIGQRVLRQTMQQVLQTGQAPAEGN